MKKMIQNHLTEKFEKIKDSLDRISKKKASSYLKQTVINLYDTEFTKKRNIFAKFRKELCSNNDNYVFKIEEQLVKEKKIANNPTLFFIIRNQKILPDKKRKQVYRLWKFPAKPVRYYILTIYGAVKTHKPEKNYLMRAILLTIGTLSYGIYK